MIYGRKHGLPLVTLAELEAKALFFRMLFIFLFCFYECLHAIVLQVWFKILSCFLILIY